MKMKLSLFSLAMVLLISACGDSDKKNNDGGTSSGKEESKSAWSEERKQKEVADCITSMMFKKENDALPEETKKKVCNCAMEAKMARFPDGEKANMDQASQMGVDKIMAFRDSCIASIVK